ncbi:hypothetical protein BGZ96_011809 [Linnemannia gamsii]|uniref:Phenazine biosynthesis protein n=1 Tax=Linnemannia gamsii TaxID=64522 RepID=A0ABQ7JRN0_9FUNG|nr:hypothetical protein BGZ96_011809 [Linnemannia gamsii]
MTSTYPFYQIDVFTDKGFLGNPLAVIVAFDPALPIPTDQQMLKIANWTNLSETTFLLPPTDPTKADYKVRIFTPNTELPFAGHPTIGTCRAFLEHTQSKKKHVVQECEAGFVELQVADSGSIAFTAPPLRKTGPVEEETVRVVCEAMGITREDVLDTQWLVNGPHWFGLLLKDAETVLKASRIPTSGSKQFEFGIVGLYPKGAAGHDKEDGSAPFLEIRAFPHVDLIDEDPVCGSFNAGVAQWLIGNGVAPASYVASQGLALGRRGRIVVHRDDSDLSLEASKRAVWVGGQTVICIQGTIQV